MEQGVINESNREISCCVNNNVLITIYHICQFKGIKRNLRTIAIDLFLMIYNCMVFVISIYNVYRFNSIKQNSKILYADKNFVYTTNQKDIFFTYVNYQKLFK